MAKNCWGYFIRLNSYGFCCLYDFRISIGCPETPFLAGMVGHSATSMHRDLRQNGALASRNGLEILEISYQGPREAILSCLKRLSRKSIFPHPTGSRPTLVDVGTLFFRVLLDRGFTRLLANTPDLPISGQSLRISYPSFTLRQTYP